MSTQPPVTVEHGGMTVTTNTASEADLLKELETPAETPAAPAEVAATPSEPKPPTRDEKGRFAKTEAATPPAELPGADVTEPPAETTEHKENPRAHFQSRLNKITQQKAEAERRAQAAEAALALIQQRMTTGQPPPLLR